jgi:hypothetical protein
MSVVGNPRIIKPAIGIDKSVYLGRSRSLPADGLHGGDATRTRFRQFLQTKCG